MEHVDLGKPYSTDRVLDAYEKSPRAAAGDPRQDLRLDLHDAARSRTRDSVAYVFERTRSICSGTSTARRVSITEHPLAARRARPRSSPSPAPSSFRQARCATCKPEIETIDVDCDSKEMIKVEPGSITTPVPRQRPG